MNWPALPRLKQLRRHGTKSTGLRRHNRSYRIGLPARIFSSRCSASTRLRMLSREATAHFWVYELASVVEELPDVSGVGNDEVRAGGTGDFRRALKRLAEAKSRAVGVELRV